LSGWRKCKKTLTHSNQDNWPNLFGSIEGALITIHDFDKDMLSEYGLKIAIHVKQIRDIEQEKLANAAKELDDLFEEE
jgi:hypothetical protein